MIEIWSYRNLLRVKWIYKVRNKEGLKKKTERKAKFIENTVCGACMRHRISSYVTEGATIFFGDYIFSKSATDHAGRWMSKVTRLVSVASNQFAD